MNKIVLASDNKGKLAELQAVLKFLDIELIPQGELGISSAEETGLSFVENALLKARHASKVSGMPALSDDSGLVVNALHGQPGIYSARFAGENANAQDNNIKLLKLMEETPVKNRDAYFYCVIVLIQHADDPTPLIAQGKWSGVIADAARGENGFG
ncbi:unnamed protein product, partial [marine sediment metagenome]